LKNQLAIHPFFVSRQQSSRYYPAPQVAGSHGQICVPEETHFLPSTRRPFLSLQRGGDLDRAVELLNRQPVILKCDVHQDGGEIEGLEGDRACVRAVDLLMRRKCGLDGNPSGQRSHRRISSTSRSCRNCCRGRDPYTSIVTRGMWRSRSCLYRGVQTRPTPAPAGGPKRSAFGRR
jgi:hypothetical protein